MGQCTHTLDYFFKEKTLQPLFLWLSNLILNISWFHWVIAALSYADRVTARSPEWHLLLLSSSSSSSTWCGWTGHQCHIWDIHGNKLLWYKEMVTSWWHSLPSSPGWTIHPLLRNKPVSMAPRSAFMPLVLCLLAECLRSSPLKTILISPVWLVIK